MDRISADGTMHKGRVSQLATSWTASASARRRYCVASDIEPMSARLEHRPAGWQEGSSGPVGVVFQATPPSMHKDLPAG